MPPKGHSGSTRHAGAFKLETMNEKSPPRKLTRSRNDRYIGGVAAGIASYLKVDPIFVRIAFIASLTFGGLGLLAYAVLLAVMPVEGSPDEPLPPIEPKRRNMMIGLAVIVGLLALVTADSGGFADWFFGFWPGVVFGILFWVAAVVAAIWLLASGTFNRDDSPTSPTVPPATPPAVPAEPAGAAPTEEIPSEETVETAETKTFAESPTQVPLTAVMPTRGARPRGDDVGDTGPGGPAPVRDDGPSTVGKIMLWFAIGLSALTVFCILFVISAGTTALFGGVPMAALVIVLGGGMVFAALRGRRQISLWLLTAALAVTIPMAAVSIADLRVEGSYGDINKTPLSVVDLPDDGYRMAAGNMTIDLRRFDFEAASKRSDRTPGWENNDLLNLPVQSGMGLTSIIVPDDVCVVGQIEGKAGVANFRGRQSDGLNLTQSAEVRGYPFDPRIVEVDAEFKLGAFEIVDDTQWRQDGRGGSFDDDHFDSNDQTQAAARSRAASACSEPVRAPKRTGQGRQAERDA